jgi:hypothetical protein
VTGVLVRDESVDAFADGLRQISTREFDPDAIRSHAEQFSKERFKAEFQQVVRSALQ